MEPELRRRQVQAFLHRYVLDEGYLPSLAEVALGCGLRSKVSAGSVVRQLEGSGVVRHLGPQLRLGSVDPVLAPGEPVATPDDELVLCELVLVVTGREVDVLNRALLVAPALDEQELLHREAIGHVALRRSFAYARDRLLGAGAQLSLSARQLLAGYAAAPELLGSADTWVAYCASSLAMNLLTVAVIEEMGWERFPYLGPLLLAEWDLCGRADVVRWRARALPQESVPLVRDLASRGGALLAGLRGLLPIAGDPGAAAVDRLELALARVH